MCDLEGLTRIADEELGTGPHCPLMHAQHAELADVWINRDLEHMRDDVFAGIRRDSHALGLLARAPEERWRVAFRGVRQESRENPQQIRYAGARLRRRKAHWNEMALAQGLLKRVVQLLRRDLLALLQIHGHELLVELDHLIDELSVRALHGGEVRCRAMRLKETVHHGLAALRGKVEGQTFRSERRADLRQHIRGFGVPAVDLVDDHEPAEPTIA